LSKEVKELSIKEKNILKDVMTGKLISTNNVNAESRGAIVLVKIIL
jgi:hypothetical protein